MAHTRETDTRPRSQAQPDHVSGGVSLDAADAIDAGLFGKGLATIKESIFADYTYTPKIGKPTTSLVWLVTYARGDETYEQPYTIGSSWESPDEETLVPKAGQTGLPKTCNATKYLTRPLSELGFPRGRLGTSPRSIEGLEVVVDRIPQEVRDFADGRKPREGATILTIVEIVNLDAFLSGARPGATTVKASARASAKANAKAGAVDDEQARGASNGEAGEQELTELAAEALAELFVRSDQIDVADLTALLKKSLKGHEQLADIIDMATSSQFLKQNLGWTYDARKGCIVAD